MNRRFVLVVAVFVAVLVLLGGERLDAAGEDNYYKLGPDSLEQEGVPQRKAHRAAHAAVRSVSRNAAHVLGVRAGAVRRGQAGGADDLQRRAGVHESRKGTCARRT